MVKTASFKRLILRAVLRQVSPKVVDGLDDFRTYICNNREFIPNFGERRRHGETISTAFVESTINHGLRVQYLARG
jgi:hypothetical protein